MWFGCGSIKSGPILEYPLIEHNDKRQLRPVYLNIRQVRGKRGWLLRKFGKYFVEDRTPEAMGHHALQIGEYAYELHTDEANQKYLMVQRLTGEQIWQPKLANGIVGYCDLTDDEVAIEAIRVQSWMRGRQGGRYHVKDNNCQHFVEELWRRVCIKGCGMDDPSLASLGSVAWKYAAGEGYDSKEASLLSGVTIRVDDCSDSAVSLSSNDVR
ncbi:hypothetical protein LTR85_010820 [Meristemomyces frigidus]|nr:hypothetical protein LTR85_010820 [Meristemomyces frigidus]